MTTEEIRAMLIGKGLKVTPQRIAILTAVLSLGNHPNADQVLEHIRVNNPNISLATVYKVLDTLVENRLIIMVKTDKDIKRYDAFTEKHHHIYYSDSDKIEDYIDAELTDLLEKYFQKKEIPEFTVEDIKVQIIGKSVHRKK